MPDDDVHFDFDVVDSADDGEELAAGSHTARHRSPRRPTPRLPGYAWVAGALVVAVGAVVVHGAAGQSHQPQASTPTAAASTTPAPSASSATLPDPGLSYASPAPVSPEAMALDVLAQRADSVTPVAEAGPLPSDTVGCPTPTSGGDPTLRVPAVLRKQLPQFTLHQQLVSLAASDGSLCGIYLQAADQLGAVLVVSIVAPQASTGPTFAAGRSNDRTTELDVAVRSAGWRIEVGWIGQTGTQPSRQDLTTLAHVAALRW